MGTVAEVALFAFGAGVDGGGGSRCGGRDRGGFGLMVAAPVRDLAARVRAVGLSGGMGVNVLPQTGQGLVVVSVVVS